jgi:hypothetical protein
MPAKAAPGGKMKRFLLALLAVATALAMAPLAFADGTDPNDPFFNENGTGACNPTGGPAWCAGWSIAQDPISGISTLEYTLSPNVYSNVVSGDVLVTESTGPEAGQVGDLIRFETVGNNFEVFIFSDDVNGGQAADVGLPNVFQLNQASISEGSSGITSNYTPVAGQPGYPTEKPGQANYSTYGLSSPSDVPEPSSLLLLGSGLLTLAGMLRRKLAR